jgi:hypothetical protein
VVAVSFPPLIFSIDQNAEVQADFFGDSHV